ncbi:MAG TPA: RNA degradosome polyphosphate kinase, partial [Firmicutes bacterium]|nr:RNA degradosome polyphosphate kinase [Bacillota bacterium]
DGSYKRLLVAPSSMKSSLTELIDDEIDKGSNGHIIIKVNSITERDLIDKLAEASQHGVKVELIVRGICCIVPGIANKTENITVISIVGRFLEHSRVYCFGDGDSRKIYISSADIMTRNQTRRVEIACPVESKEIHNWLSSYLDILLKDNVKARFLLPSGDYINIEPGNTAPLSSQQYFMENPPEFQSTIVYRRRFVNFFRKIFKRSK